MKMYCVCCAACSVQSLSIGRARNSLLRIQDNESEDGRYTNAQCVVLAIEQKWQVKIITQNAFKYK